MLWAHKIGIQNRKKLDNTTDPSSAPSIPSYSYERLNKNTDSNTTVVLPPHFHTYIQTQCNSASDSCAGANDIASYGLNQRTNHHVKKDKKDNDDSQLYEKP